MSGEGGYQPEVEESVELLPKAPKGGSGEKPFNPKPTGAMDEMREALEEVQTLLDEGLKNFQVKDTPIELIEAVGLVGIMLDRLALAATRPTRRCQHKQVKLALDWNIICLQCNEAVGNAEEVSTAVVRAVRAAVLSGDDPFAASAQKKTQEDE